MQPDVVEQLAVWLASTDIGLLELRGPDSVLRLGPDAQDPPGAAVDTDVVRASSRAGFAVRSPSVGIVRSRHPLHDERLTAPGAAVAAGQPLALLQVGALLIPVTAPRHGTVVRVLIDDGSVVGYGATLLELHH